MPTLARLSFWVPPEQIDSFQATYKKKLVPILKKHGLAESSERGRTTVEDVFSRLFEVRTPSEVAAKERALRQDPAWKEVLQSLGAAFGTPQPDGLLRTRFGLYRTPAGSGKTVEAGAGFRQRLWQSFGVQDGLPSSTIFDILQDKEGNLWFGTQGRGVCRYDGAQFVTFTTEDGLASNDVWCILQDRDGNLWFGTGWWGGGGGGVSRYDAHRLKGEEFVTFTTEDGLASNTVWCIQQDREGNLWFGTKGGVSRYDAHHLAGEQFVTFTTEDGLVNNTVWYILQDREGLMWFGTKGGVSRYDAHRPAGEQFVTFTIEDGLANNCVTSILEDREGHLWFGGGGVSRYDAHRSAGQQFASFSTEDGPAHNEVKSILEDQRGDLWFGGEGVSRYDGHRPAGQQFVTFTTDDGLAHNEVTCIVEDREGNLWFGTNGGGVSRYNAHCLDGEQFVTFTTEDGLADNQVFCLLEDWEGELWFGAHGGGVSRYDTMQFAAFTVEEGLVNNGVMAILQDRKGDLWFGTWGGVSRYEANRPGGKQFTNMDDLAGKFVWSIVEDREGHLWFGILGGVSRYDVHRPEGEQFTALDDLAGKFVRSILEDREGRLWFGTYGEGVIRYDAHCPAGEQVVTFTTEDGLASDRVLCVFEDREGHLWFGTEGNGVSRYDGKAFVTFTTEEGLPSNRVSCIFEDREGHLWFGTEGGGVSRYDGHHADGDHRPDGEKFVTFSAGDGLGYDMVISIFQDRAGHLWFGTFGGGVSRYDGLVFQRLSKKDGLLHDAVQHILQDRNGDFWIATEGGITRYRPHHTPPTIRIKEVIADQRYGSVQEIRIPSSQKFIVFEFQGGSLTTRPDGMAYVYRMEGYDLHWKPVYTGRVEYQDLPLGEYTFQVKAVDRDFNYSEPATVRVIIEPDPRLEAFAEALSATSEEFVGNSKALRRVEKQLVEVASTDLTVLILGETGTGKGLAARILHGLSKRQAGPFIQVHCGAIPEALVESELFGHERGAFTGAVARKLGKIELAEGGTLFLDEIGDMPFEAQVKLLRLLEERTFERVGGTETLQADIRIIAATNRNLQQMVATGTFRQDLYFRLQVFLIELPPLRERREDISLLAAYFMGRMAAHLDREVSQLTPEALAMLQAYDWPGNIRELEHVVKRAVIVCPGPAIRVEDMVLGVGQANGRHAEERVPLEEYERRYIREVLEETGWVIAGAHGAAAVLGLHEATLRSRMKKLGVARPQA